MSWLVGWITSCFLPCKNDCDKAPLPLVNVRSITFDKRKNKSFNSIDKNLSLTCTKYNNRQLDNKLIMKDKFVEDKFVDDDFIVFNFKENDVKDDKGVHIYARPSLLKFEEIDNKQRLSIESKDSFESEDNADSFSFPVLDWERIGSPVRMPKPEDQQHLKNQKVRCVKFRTL